MTVRRKEKEVRRFVPCGLRKEWENRSERERKSESDKRGKQIERKRNYKSVSAREGETRRTKRAGWREGVEGVGE